MGICYVTFAPTEERIPGDGKKKKSSVVEVPGWRHARAAQMQLNGKPIGVNVGAQKESLMKVVLDPNGDRTRKIVEMELEKRKRASNGPVVVPPVNTIPGSAKGEVALARPTQAPPTQAASASVPVNALSMPPPTTTPTYRPQPLRNDAFAKPFMQHPGPYPGRSTTFDSRLPPRANDRSTGTSFGHEPSGQGLAGSRNYRDSSAQGKPVGLGRLPPMGSNSYGSIRTGSSYTPSSQLSSFVSAPFPTSRGYESRQHGSRGHADDARRAAGSVNENSRLPERPNPPSMLESSSRRRSARSSDGSDSGESSQGGRTPSPTRRLDRRRGLNRDANLRRRPPRGDDPAAEEQQDEDEAAQLVAKVRDELQENAKAYIFIDHRSLPIPSAKNDRERVLADLKDHLKAAKIEKV